MSVSGRISGDDGGSRRDFPNGVRGLQSRSRSARRGRKATAELQAGRPGYRALWNHFFATSRLVWKREWGSLGVQFDLWKGEASVDSLMEPMIEELKARHIAEESEGALVIRIARNDDKKEMPPLILVKSTARSCTAATDLATIIDACANRIRPHSLVVDQRQHQHFEQVFRAAHKAASAARRNWSTPASAR